MWNRLKIKAMMGDLRWESLAQRCQAQGMKSPGDKTEGRKRRNLRGIPSVTDRRERQGRDREFTGRRDRK